MCKICFNNALIKGNMLIAHLFYLYLNDLIVFCKLLLFQLFTNVKLWCYRITSLICGLPLAIYWGVYFALLSFCAIWCCEPYLKAYAIELGCVRRIFQTMLNAFYRPCFEAIGYIFYNIRIQKV